MRLSRSTSTNRLSIWLERVVTGQEHSISQRRRRSLRLVPGSRSPNTEIALLPRQPARPTCSRLLESSWIWTRDRTAQMVREIGFGFLFAPHYHPAMRHAGPVRKQLGFRTVFNFLGPLCNPARARRYALGVSDPRMAGLMIHVLQQLGAESAFVYYGEDGLDELTTTGPSFIYRLRAGEITHAEFTPEDFGVPRTTIDQLAGGDPEVNVAITREVLAGETGPRLDISLVNAAPAIVAAGLAEGFVEAMALARESVQSGSAAMILEKAVAFSEAER